VLLEQPARNIEARLHPDQGGPKPEQDHLCLNCHVQPGIMQSARSPGFALSDGVGCESCHGPAENYLREHTLPGWRLLGPHRKRELGMKDTVSPAGRVAVCTPCHIGQGDIEVNHDLIAAGHPRLRFEFAAYLANFPSHWRANNDLQEARAWMVGQAVSAESVLRLLAHRANSSRAVWPELAELDCYACHHDLAPKNWRQQDLPPGARPGALLLNEWYYAALPVLGNQTSEVFRTSEVYRFSSQRRQDRARVADQATRLADQLKDLSAALERKPIGDADRTSLLAVLEAEALRSGRPSWDRETQLYLGAAALTAGRGPRQGALRQAVAELGSLLDQAFQTSGGQPLDSPHRFDPVAVKKGWEKISQTRGHPE
jgi:hypothetical protein